MEFRHQQLDNGLEIMAECIPAARYTAVGVFVRAGARDEPPEWAGVSHFLEHMVFKGTATRSADDVNRQLDALGASSNAYTGDESTVYYASVLPEFQRPIVELLTDLMRPALRADDFATEQHVIIEEIRMYDDQPPYGAPDILAQEFYCGHPVSNRVLGTENTVGAMTPDSMWNYWSRNYVPGNMAIAAAGNVDFSVLVDDVARCCDRWSAGTAQRLITSPQTKSGFRLLHKPQAVQQYILQMARGPATSDPDRYAATLLAVILDEVSTRGIYWTFLDTGLAEEAGFGLSSQQGAGAFTTFLYCDPAHAKENVQRLDEVHQHLKVAGISAEDLQLAKQKVVSNLVLAGERSDQRMFRLGDRWLDHKPYETLRQTIERYQAVTMDELHDVRDRFPLDERMTVAVGPLEELGTIAAPIVTSNLYMDDYAPSPQPSPPNRSRSTSR